MQIRRDPSQLRNRPAAVHVVTRRYLNTAENDMVESNYKSGHELVAHMRELCDVRRRSGLRISMRYALQLGAAQLEEALRENERLRAAVQIYKQMLSADEQSAGKD